MLSNRLSQAGAYIVFGIASIAQTARSGPNARDLFLDGIEGRSTLGQSRDLMRRPRRSDSNPTLGIRYNVLLYPAGDPHKPAEPVRSEHQFRTGDCIALEVETNRDGYLYIVAHGTSGGWSALVPSEIDRKKVNRVTSGVRVRAPQTECFELTNPPGTENLFLILLQEPSDVDELMRLYWLSSLTRTSPAGTGGDPMERVRKQFASRDLRIQKMQRPEAPDEQPFVVYAIAPPPRLFVEVKLRHE